MSNRQGQVINLKSQVMHDLELNPYTRAWETKTFGKKANMKATNIFWACQDWGWMEVGSGPFLLGAAS